MTTPTDGSDPVADPDKPFLEFLGPTNEMVRCIEDSKTFEANHLSIMCRVTWKGFRMIIAGDAQMENWAAFDRERLLEDKCQVLRAAHHGSKNGTQWERLERLGPSAVIISSDPESKDELPDLCGSAIFAKFDGPEGRFALMTKDTGTVHLSVSSAGKWAFGMMGDSVDGNVNLQNPVPLAEASNPTNWIALLQNRMTNL
jgi:hypothetical protein